MDSLFNISSQTIQSQDKPFSSQNMDETQSIRKTMNEKREGFRVSIRKQSNKKLFHEKRIQKLNQKQQLFYDDYSCQKLDLFLSQLNMDPRQNLEQIELIDVSDQRICEYPQREALLQALTSYTDSINNTVRQSSYSLLVNISCQSFAIDYLKKRRFQLNLIKAVTDQKIGQDDQEKRDIMKIKYQALQILINLLSSNYSMDGCYDNFRDELFEFGLVQFLQACPLPTTFDYTEIIASFIENLFYDPLIKMVVDLDAAQNMLKCLILHHIKARQNPQENSAQFIGFLQTDFDQLLCVLLRALKVVYKQYNFLNNEKEKQMVLGDHLSSGLMQRIVDTQLDQVNREVLNEVSNLLFFFHGKRDDLQIIENSCQLMPIIIDMLQSGNYLMIGNALFYLMDIFEDEGNEFFLCLTEHFEYNQMFKEILDFCADQLLTGSQLNTLYMQFLYSLVEQGPIGYLDYLMKEKNLCDALMTYLKPFQNVINAESIIEVLYVLIQIFIKMEKDQDIRLCYKGKFDCCELVQNLEKLINFENADVSSLTSKILNMYQQL